MEMETQMQTLGKQPFVGPCRDNAAECTLISRPCSASPATPSLISLQIPLVIPLFWEEVLYLTSLGSSGGEVKRKTSGVFCFLKIISLN